MLEKESLELLRKSLDKLESGFGELPGYSPYVDKDKLESVLQEVAVRMQDNFPYFHPFYAGQMLKPPHPVARLAYFLSMWINPNNHALDGGRASSEMEKEVVRDLAQMFGWEKHLGHLCGGGTMANLEALWVSKCLNPDKGIAASELSHYTHSRISEVLGIPFFSIPCDRQGVIEVVALEELLQKEDIGTVVCTMGTTGMGQIDPLDEVCELQERYDFRIHADCAYGGYFPLASNLSSSARSKYAKLNQVDSLVIDPHKHGLQPYGCGCILFSDPTVGRFYQHSSPYTYFSSQELHLGEISLECSRAGAAAVALWATHQLMPPEKGGKFSQDLEKSIKAAQRLAELIQASDDFLLVVPPELDIVCWAPRKPDTEAISQESQRIFDEAARQGVHLALFNHPSRLLGKEWEGIEKNTEYVCTLRSVLMKPEHLDWVERIWGIVVRGLRGYSLLSTVYS